MRTFELVRIQTEVADFLYFGTWNHHELALPGEKLQVKTCPGNPWVNHQKPISDVSMSGFP
jgi:hypothetical protein